MQRQVAIVLPDDLADELERRLSAQRSAEMAVRRGRKPTAAELAEAKRLAQETGDARASNRMLREIQSPRPTRRMPSVTSVLVPLIRAGLAAERAAAPPAEPGAKVVPLKRRGGA